MRIRRFAAFQAQWLNVHVDFPLLQRLATYIRQLRDGLPRSCMHSADDRGDGATLFAGARDANRILELPVAPLPAPAGPEAL